MRSIQLFVDGLRFGLLIAICAVGLSLIFGTTGLTNFAHGELVTIGAVVAWYINVRGRCPAHPGHAASPWSSVSSSGRSTSWASGGRCGGAAPA